MHVAPKWRDLGVQLLSPHQQKDIEIIGLDHPLDTVECCKCVLKKWLDTTAATWNQLISALRSPTIQLDSLAINIESIMIPVKVRFVVARVNITYVGGSGV